MIKKFKSYLNESHQDDEINILKSANRILRKYKSSPTWNEIAVLFNNRDIDYSNWTDLEILAFYLRYEGDLS